MSDKPVSISEYSEMTGLSRSQIYARIAAGKIVADRTRPYRVYPEATKAHQLKLAVAEAERKASVHQPLRRRGVGKPIQQQKPNLKVISGGNMGYREACRALIPRKEKVR